MRASFIASMPRGALCAVLFGATISLPVRAQLPSASAAAQAMAGNFTAVARGYEAIAWNPANLAMPGRPFISFGTAIVGGNLGLTPVDFTKLHNFSGKVIDSATKVTWINDARAAGGQKILIDAGLTPIALSVGPVGLQFGGQVYSNVNLSPDALEAVLFGNAGNNNNLPKTLDFTGTSVRAGAFSAGGLSFALPLPLSLAGGVFGEEHFAIGVTGKYIMGHGLVIAQDNGSSLSGNTLQLRFPMILPDSNFDGILGTGTGADVSFAWSGGPWRLGLMAENVMNSFKWDTTKLAFAPGTTTSTSDSTTSNFDQKPYNQAPAALRGIVAAQSFKPSYSIGAALKLMDNLTVTGDIKTSLGGDDAIIFGPKQRFGVGAEYRPIFFLPLRAGFASVTGGWQAGAGFGIRLLGFEIGAATSIREMNGARQSGFMLGLVGIGH